MAHHRRPLKDPATNQPRGNLTARVTFVKIDPGPVYLFLGFASHHLPTDEITVHSSWRSDQPTPVSITGGSGQYKDARGTVTYKDLGGNSAKQQFTYEVLP